MLDLCNILDINVNELLSGERINMKDISKKTEELLMEMVKQEEIKNKKILTSMWTILIVDVVFYTGIILLAVNTLEEGTLLGTIICISTIIFVIAGFIALKFEVDAGYYECKNCHHRYVPTYMQVLFAPHIITNRYLKCPKCNKRSWCKKVMTK